jgi:hypothetical protein
MTRFRAILLAATLLTPVIGPVLAPSPTMAATDPAPGPKDSRIRTTRYDPDQVVRLTSTGQSPLEVIFEAGEHPVTIAGAQVFTDPKEAKDWLARPSGNVLILQPLRAMEPSVLFVRTPRRTARNGITRSNCAQGMAVSPIRPILTLT